MPNRKCVICRVALYLLFFVSTLAYLRKGLLERNLHGLMESDRSQLLLEWIHDGRILINWTDSRKRSLLHVASNALAVNCVAALLELGADPNFHDLAANTPLHLAIGQGDENSSAASAVAALLITHGAHVNVANNAGQTALHIAMLISRPTDITLVQLLCNHGADSNLKDKSNANAYEIGRALSKSELLMALDNCR